MTRDNDPLKTAFDTLKEEISPSAEQKEKMLNHVLLEIHSSDESAFGKIRRLIFNYPWRFAFTLSTIQAVVFTLIFGNQYTNIFLGFGG